MNPCIWVRNIIEKPRFPGVYMAFNTVNFKGLFFTTST
nr:MAG TPA: hypothetical protein [Caudoviricetes sp.]